jgi:hypothetical protein
MYSPLTLARRHVLGELYGQCERVIKDVPVYLNDLTGERLGHVDESLGKYADAFTFHLSEENCKKLAGGQFTYSFDCRFTETLTDAVVPRLRRVRLISIFLILRKGYEKPVSRTGPKASSEPETEPA